MAHPGGLLLGLAGKERRETGIDGSCSCTVFTKSCFSDIATKRLGHHLESVANAEDWNTKLEDALLQGGRPFFIDAGWATAQHNGQRVLSCNLRCGGMVGNDFGVDAGFTNPPSDQLGVLGAKIHDQNRSMLTHESLPAVAMISSTTR